MHGTRRRLLVAGAFVVVVAISGAPVVMAAQESPPHSTGPSAAPAAGGFVRGVYGKDSSTSGVAVMAANGFNSVMTGPYAGMIDPLVARGLKGVVWLGDFVNRPTCAFQRDDATIARLVKALAGDKSVLAYYLGDEPHVTECPGAPALFRKRSDLVHVLDPGSKTFTVIQASENGVTHDYAPWAGSVDIIGFDVYPCARAASACNFGLIDAAVAAIHAAGIKDFWAIPQDFQDCYYRLPSPRELAVQFDHWAGSGMSGYFVFSWNYAPKNPACTGVSLEQYPDNVAQLKVENGRPFSSVPPPVTVTPDRTPVAVVLIVLLLVVLVGVAAVTLPRIGRTTR